MVKDPPVNAGLRFSSWVGKILLKKEMAPHSSMLVWRIPWTEEPGGTVHGVSKSQMRLSMHKYPIKMLISMMVQQVKNFPARRHKFDLESGKLQFKGLQKSQT